jgi:hypothetical protein
MAIRWHRGSGLSWDQTPRPGHWYAEDGGKVVARAAVSDRVAPGYWGRYHGHIYGRETFTATLAEFRTRTLTAYNAQQTGAPS